MRLFAYVRLHCLTINRHKAHMCFSCSFSRITTNLIILTTPLLANELISGGRDFSTEQARLLILLRARSAGHDKTAAEEVPANHLDATHMVN